jgi:hypothetical protein
MSTDDERSHKPHVPNPDYRLSPEQLDRICAGAKAILEADLALKPKEPPQTEDDKALASLAWGPDAWGPESPGGSDVPPENPPAEDRAT